MLSAPLPFLPSDYLEQEQPLPEDTGAHDHFLNQVSRSPLGEGEYDPLADQLPVQKGEDGKTPLFCCAMVRSLDDIDGANSKFGVQLRLYFVWQINRESFPTELFDCFAAKASTVGYYSLDNSEVKRVVEAFDLPRVDIFNAVNHDTETHGSLRFYAGAHNRCAIMWNYAVKATLMENFEFHTFPFDVQRLQIHLQLQDPRTWDLYRLASRMSSKASAELRMSSTRADVHNIIIILYTAMIALQSNTGLSPPSGIITVD